MSDTFVAKFPFDDPEAMEKFQEFMDKANNAMSQEIVQLTKDLDIPEILASEIWYLRTRSRHKIETEERMIKAYKATGISDFRCCAGEEEEELTKLGF